ncbi:hypothetical protein VTO42DRAFT_1253 [Malbranchea cinnamomea]
MSEPTSPSKATDRKDDGLSKYMKRMKTVLRRGTRSNRNSVSSISGVMSDSSKPAVPKAANSATSAAAPASSASARPAATQKTTTQRTAAVTSAQEWRAAQQERARALFAKYGLTLEPDEWIVRPVRDDVERVSKPIRMRVRRNCHRCLTSLGVDKICPSCHHLRCQKCFRYPPAKLKQAPEAEKIRPKAETEASKRSEKLVLTIPSRTGGQDLVRKPIRQIVRRYCHVCQTMFIGDATECTKCQHVRCKKCPRDPPKLNKHPDGYPGDAEPPVQRQERVFRKPRRRIRWTCHSCNKPFSFGDKECQQCGHERCKDCIRDPPKKIKPEPDPEVLRRVEEKLARFKVSEQTPA